MREEELYKLAKEELNSRNRKADLWARACALATDDVDEARYLYTNLRVEELATEHNVDLTALDHEATMSTDANQNTITGSTGDLSETLAVASADADLTPAQLALERARQTYGGSNDTETSSTKADTAETANVANAGTDNAVKGDALALSLEALDKTAGEEKASTSISDLVLGDIANDLATEADNTVHINADDNDLTEVLSSVDILALEPNESEKQPANGKNAEPARSEKPQNDFPAILDSKSDVTEESKTSLPASQETLTAVNDAPPLTANEDAANDDAPVDEQADNKSVEVTSDDTSNTRGIEAVPGLAAASVKAGEQKLTPEVISEENSYDYADDDGSGRFAIYEDPQGLVSAVERGGNWKAMLLTQPWLLSRKMWGTALMYAVMTIVLFIGLFTMLPRALGQQAGTLDLPVAAGFVLLAVIGWLFLPFKFSNEWYENKIVRRGYRLLKTVDADNRQAAEQAYLIESQRSG